ncbi:hypothetical protein [Bacillus sp. FJAT-52991]|uniref:Uncharacterized protein n=1 Tax=Bacillus kandeliae TaxID=3129297 RepID=A0ABZ2N1Y8_9BACI
MASPQRFPFGRREIFDQEREIAKVGHSGNSDVDIHIDVEVDTKPVAYAMLCSLLATKQLTTEEFEEALERLQNLIDKDKNTRVEKKNNHSSRVKLFNQNGWEDQR